MVSCISGAITRLLKWQASTQIFICLWPPCNFLRDTEYHRYPYEMLKLKQSQFQDLGQKNKAELYFLGTDTDQQLHCMKIKSAGFIITFACG